MTEKRQPGGVSYQIPGGDYFEKRGLKRHAGVFSLWALGVGAVISGEFSGWNLGFAEGGWGGMFVGTIIIAVMYLGLTFSIAEMSPALPHFVSAYLRISGRSSGGGETKDRPHPFGPRCLTMSLRSQRRQRAATRS